MDRLQLLSKDNKTGEGEAAIYQNMIAANGRFEVAPPPVPERQVVLRKLKTDGTDDEIYAQVSYFRKSVREVNQLLNEPKRKTPTTSNDAAEDHNT